MSLISKSRFAMNDARIVWSILRNTGKIPHSRKSMVTLELCSVCNLTCPLCPTGTGKTKRKNRFMPREVLDRIISLTRPVAQGTCLACGVNPCCIRN